MELLISAEQSVTCGKEEINEEADTSRKSLRLFYLLVELGENVVKLEIPKLFEDFIFTFDLGHESIKIGVRELS